MSSAAITARFGAAVRNMRFRLGLSQEELAERADLHRTYIAGIERGGRNVTLKSAAKLADALKVSIGQLLSSETENHQRANLSARQALSGSMVDILLVEDNPDDVELTLDAFREMKIANRVKVVPDGVQALEYIFGARAPVDGPVANLPQLILLDLQLPKVSGFEVLRRLKQDSRTKKIPVIVLTISQNSSDVAESRRLGAETYLVKPVDFLNFCQVTPQLKFRWVLYEPLRVARA